MITLNAAKGNFFDRQKVINATDRATRSVLSRFGAFVRTRARTSMRKRKGVSAPGSPPHAHVGLIRKLLFFVYEPERKTVVIGPTLINTARKNPTVPELLEEGGEVVIERRDGTRERAKYRARPYMGPAAATELPKLPAMWRNSVR
jgi:hypothetical protein